MIDDIGYYIRMSIVGLSLVILGLFTIFFVRFVPLAIGVIISILGLLIAIFYIFKVIIQSIVMFKVFTECFLLNYSKHKTEHIIFFEYTGKQSKYLDADEFISIEEYKGKDYDHAERIRDEGMKQ